MRASAILLSEYRSEIVALACNKCERRGRYRKSSLVAIHGPKIALSDLRSRFAADCPKMRSPCVNDDCGVHYPDLAGDDGTEL
jgi:hypothetical protein